MNEKKIICYTETFKKYIMGPVWTKSRLLSPPFIEIRTKNNTRNQILMYPINEYDVYVTIRFVSTENFIRTM